MTLQEAILALRDQATDGIEEVKRGMDSPEKEEYSADMLFLLQLADWLEELQEARNKLNVIRDLHESNELFGISLDAEEAIEEATK